MSLIGMIHSGADYLSSASRTLQDPRLTNEELVEVFDNLKVVEGGIGEVVKVARERVMELVKNDGEQDGNSLKLNVGEFEVLARPRKLGPDAKLVQALLESKGLELNVYMTPKISYSVNEAALKILVANGALTEAEVKACIPEVEYNLLKPNRL